MQRFIPFLALPLLSPATLNAVTPYSAGTVGTLNSSAGSQSLYRSDISNPTQTLSLAPTAISDGAVGRSGVTTAAARAFWQVAAFKVSDLMAATGSSSLADLANFSFTYTGVTEASTTLIPAANEYRAAYLGQWEDSGSATTDVPLRGTAAVGNAQNMTDTGNGASDPQRTLFGTAIETISSFAAPQAAQQVVDLNLTDLASSAQTLTAKGFNLSHLATDLASDTDLGNNYVFFTFYLDPKLASGTALAQCISGVQLIPVENADPKTLASGTYEVAGPQNTDAWGFKNLDQSGGTIRFELDGSGPDQLFVQGNFTHTAGDISMRLYAAPATGTPVPLLRYEGTMTGSPAVSLVDDTRFTLSASSLGDGSNDTVSATFSGAPANLFWTGSQGPAWDLKSTQNWELIGVPETFHNVDQVSFDDLAANFTPTLGTTLYPSAVKFDNTSAHDYTLGGAGSIGGGASLELINTGKVILLGDHGYTGSTTISNADATLQLGNGGSSGSPGSGPVSLTGKLVFNRSNSQTFANAVAGSGGTFTKQGANTLTLTGNHSGSLIYELEAGTLRVGQGSASGSLSATSSLINVAAGATLEFFRSSSELAIGTILEGPGSVIFKGTDQTDQSAYSLTGISPDFAGTVTLDKARLRVDQAANDLGGATVVKALDGGQAYLPLAGDFAYPIELQGNGWKETAGQLGALRLDLGAKVTGAVTLTGDTRIGCWGSSGTISGNIAETGGARALELFSGNATTDATLALSGSNLHSGGTTVRGLTAVAQSAGAFGSGSVTLEPHPAGGARLSRLQFSAATVPNAITAKGGTSVTGNGGTSAALVLAGGSVAPGTSIGSLAAGSLTVQSGGSYAAEINSSTTTADRLTVAGVVSLESGAVLNVNDLAAPPVALPVGTKLALVDYTGGSLTGTFNGLADGAMLSVGPNTFVIDYNDTSDGVNAGLFVTLTVPAGSPYTLWAASSGLDGTPGKEAGFEDDPDRDGMANGLEWIINGNPLAATASPIITTATAGGLTLVFNREEDAIGQVSLSVEWDTDLQLPWTSVPITAGSSSGANGVTITVNDATSPDQVTVFIPAANAAGGKLMARLKATQP